MKLLRSAQTLGIAALLVVGGNLVPMGTPPAHAEPADEPAPCSWNAGSKWPPAVTRIQGADRYATAVEISKQLPMGRPIYIATGTDFPDALSAAAAGSPGDPVLLVTPTAIPDVVRQELLRRGKSPIIVVGGTSVVSEAVYEELKGHSTTITRLAGRTRYETSRLAALHHLKGNHAQRLWVATGRDYPDALSAIADTGGDPTSVVLLVDGAANNLDAATRALLESPPFGQLESGVVSIVGGFGAVSQGIDDELRRYFFQPESGVFFRFAGADRYQTSKQIQKFPAWSDSYVPQKATWTVKTSATCDPVLATGANFPDALAGSALAISIGGPLWVVPPTCIPKEIREQAQKMPHKKLYVLGGTGALSPAVEQLKEC